MVYPAQGRSVYNNQQDIFKEIKERNGMRGVEAKKAILTVHIEANKREYQQMMDKENTNPLEATTLTETQNRLNKAL